MAPGHRASKYISAPLRSAAAKMPLRTRPPRLFAVDHGRASPERSQQQRARRPRSQPITHLDHYVLIARPQCRLSW